MKKNQSNFAYDVAQNWECTKKKGENFLLIKNGYQLWLSAGGNSNFKQVVKCQETACTCNAEFSTFWVELKSIKQQIQILSNVFCDNGFFCYVYGMFSDIVFGAEIGCYQICC